MGGERGTAASIPASAWAVFLALVAASSLLFSVACGESAAQSAALMSRLFLQLGYPGLAPLRSRDRNRGLFLAKGWRPSTSGSHQMLIHPAKELPIVRLFLSLHRNGASRALLLSSSLALSVVFIHCTCDLTARMTSAPPGILEQFIAADFQSDIVILLGRRNTLRNK